MPSDTNKIVSLKYYFVNCTEVPHCGSVLRDEYLQNFYELTTIFIVLAVEIDRARNKSSIYYQFNWQSSSPRQITDLTDRPDRRGSAS